MTDTTPWLTIATIVRNDPQALRETLASVRGQTGVGYEHLIVDGASADDTLAIAEAAAENDAKVIVRSQPDVGIYDAMNKAISFSRGTYVHFLNAGDVYADEGAVAWLQSQLTATPTRWLRTPAQFVDTEGQPSRPIRPVELHAAKFINGYEPVYHQGAVMTRELLVELGGFDTSYRIAGDYDLMRRALLLGVEPQTSDRILVRGDDSGVSTLKWPASLREVNRSRSSGAGPWERTRSYGVMGLAMANVGARRLARRGSEALLGANRSRSLRGIK